MLKTSAILDRHRRLLLHTLDTIRLSYGVREHTAEHQQPEQELFLEEKALTFLVMFQFRKTLPCICILANLYQHCRVTIHLMAAVEVETIHLLGHHYKVLQAAAQLT